MSRDEKVVSVSERIPTLQEKRKRKANRRLLGFVILFFFFARVACLFPKSVK